MQSARWADEAAGLRVEVAAASAVGRRSENQDNLVVIVPSDSGGTGWRLADGRLTAVAVDGWPPAAIRLAVADGMGGHKSGRLAAELLAAALLRVPFQRSPAGLRAAVLAVHAELRTRLDGPDERRGGSTLALLDVDLSLRRAVRLHVGDSRSYLLHRSCWRRLTFDHRPHEFSWRDGDLDAAGYEHADAFGDRSLAQAVGFGSVGAFARRERAVNPDLRVQLPEDLDDAIVRHADAASVGIGPGDRILVATDGLLGGGEDNLLPRLRDGSPVELAAVVAAGMEAADDNLTGVILSIEEQGRFRTPAW